MTISGMVLNGGTVKLAELADDSHSFEGLVATDVAFEGPAVITFLGTLDMQDSGFAHGPGGLESILWEVNPKYREVLGAIALENSTFVRCTFKGIGVAGTPSGINKFVQMMTVG
jgi:hypothetical protein